MNEIEAEKAMNIILYAGSAKSTLIEALNELTETGDILKEKEKIAEAGKELGQAHEIQTSLLVEESNNEKTEPTSILMIHAQDHFMNAVTIRDMGQIFIKMYEKLA